MRQLSLILAISALIVLMVAPGYYSFAVYNPCHYPRGYDRCAQNFDKGTPPYTPEVIFPSAEEIVQYLNDTGEKKEFTILSSPAQGIPSDLKTAIAGESIWLAWLGKMDGVNHVFTTASFDGGGNFTSPVELTPSNVVNASDLQLAASADGKDIFVIWQDNVNASNGQKTVYFSSSMDWGQEFRTYSLNALDKELEFSDPQLAVSNETAWYSWKFDPCQSNNTGSCPVYAGHGRRW